MTFFASRPVALALLTVLSTACAIGRSDAEPESDVAALTATETLDRAEREIAAGSFSAAALLLKQVLTGAPPGSPNETRSLDLVDRIYERGGGAAISVDDSLPAHLHGMKVALDRFLRRPNEVGSQPGDHVLSIALSAPFPLRDEVTDLKVVKVQGSRVVLDGNDASQWGLGINRDDPTAFLTKTLPTDFAVNGLYAVSARLNDANRTPIASWFIVTRGLGTADPTIERPVNQPLTLERPEAAHTPADALLKFGDFRSDLYRPFETRHLTAILRYHQFIRGQRSTSSYWKGEFPNPDMTELRAGAGGIPLLMSGEYRFAVDYQELRGFGHFLISRGSRTIVRLFAGPPPVTACESIAEEAECAVSQSVDRGVCVWGFRGPGCVGVGDTNPIAQRCGILHGPAACSFHNVSCVWSGEACTLKP